MRAQNVTDTSRTSSTGVTVIHSDKIGSFFLVYFRIRLLVVQRDVIFPGKPAISPTVLVGNVVSHLSAVHSLLKFVFEACFKLGIVYRNSSALVMPILQW